jgi:N-acylneuraminate cytidylyltransferase
MDRCLAIIPARGGSKRIPRKNIKKFLGVPIIKYSIDAALNSHCFDEMMVSTDDKEIAQKAISFGAKVPFFRSQKTSNDFATTADVILEVLREYKKRGVEFDYFCCIYPTAPFITAKKLIKGKKLIKETTVDAVIPIVRFSYPIQRALRIDNGLLKMFWPENDNKRSQDLELVYHDAGQFYWVQTDNFLRSKTFFTDNTLPLELSPPEVQDIDIDEDWKLAEMKYRLLKRK